MNIALITAGGTGQRMHQDVPKQFLNVCNVPIIIYTLMAFQRHPNIDAIAVICLKGWQDVLRAYCRQYGITKLKWIFDGGECGQASIRSGISGLAKECSPDDIVLVHDAVRPMVSPEIISDCIAGVINYGSAIVTIPCTEAILQTDDSATASREIPRDTLKRTQTPQGLRLSKFVWAHKEALARGITNSVATCTMLIELGETVHFSIGSEKNIKLTTQDDIDIFKALLITSDRSDINKDEKNVFDQSDFSGGFRRNRFG